MNMGESVFDMLVRLSEVLHWLGKYDEANAVTLSARLIVALGAKDLNDLEEKVERFENEHIPFRDR